MKERKFFCHTTVWDRIEVPEAHIICVWVLLISSQAEIVYSGNRLTRWYIHGLSHIFAANRTHNCSLTAKFKAYAMAKHFKVFYHHILRLVQWPSHFKVCCHHISKPVTTSFQNPLPPHFKTCWHHYSSSIGCPSVHSTLPQRLQLTSPALTYGLILLCHWCVGRVRFFQHALNCSSVE